MEQIFLALDDEITGVVEKIQQSVSDDVVLIVPKGATILQSLVNIRLLMKKADEFDKKVSVVTSDAIGKQLCAQAGLKVYQSVPDGKPVVKDKMPKTAVGDDVVVDSDQKVESHDGAVRVTHYNASATEALKKAGIEPAEKIDESPPEASIEVTEDSEISDEAEIDIPAEPEVKSSASSDVIMGKVIEDDVEEHPHKTRIKLTRKPVSLPKWLWRGVALTLVLVVCAAISYAIFIPSTSVVINVPSESVKKTASIVVDTSASGINQNVIQGLAHQTTADSIGTAKATGKKQVGDKATGTVTISNADSTDVVTIAKNTALTSTDSKLVFRTQVAVSVPGDTVTKVNGRFVDNPGRADVAVIADQPGDQYNIKATSFTIAGVSSLITGASAKAMSGGTTKELTIVAEADITSAKNDAQSKMSDAALAALQKSIPSSETAFYQSVSDVTYSGQDHQVGDEASTVSITASGKANGVSYRGDDIASVLKSQFADDIPPAKNLVLPVVADIKFDVKSDSSTRFTLTKEIEGKLIANINTTEVKNKLRGRTVKGSAENIKSAYSADAVTITASPSKWPLISILANHINVTVAE
ncbi:MAG: hypothetical protein WC773_04285 [Patescibacteria group bacterium]|jgi:hypothetical protein